MERNQNKRKRKAKRKKKRSVEREKGIHKAMAELYKEKSVK